MPKQLNILFPTDWGYGYSLTLTEQEAKDLLAASTGTVVVLTNPDETVEVKKDGYFYLKKTAPGAQHEELPRASMRDKLRGMIVNGAWD